MPPRRDVHGSRRAWRTRPAPHRVVRRALAAAVAVAAVGSSLVAMTPTAEAAGCPPARTSMIRSAPGSGKTVALTFDDGPGGVTPQVLAVLRRYDVRATFFDTGAHDARFPSQVARIAREGHLVADHTWEHRYPSRSNGRWSRHYLNAEFDRTNAQQLRLTGRHTCFFRPPGGFVTSGMVAEAARNHMSTVSWSVDTNDWKQSSRTTPRSTASIVSAARQGFRQAHPIVLMHVGKASHEPERQVSANRSNDVAALPAIIRGYRSRGYRFVDMSGRSGLRDRTTSLALPGGSVTVPVDRAAAAVRATVTDVRGGVAGKPVRWYSRSSGTATWTYRGTVLTDHLGVARATDRPGERTDYTMRFPATKGYQGSTTTSYRRLNTYTPAPLPSPAVGQTSSTATCVDGSKVTWRTQVVWGARYLRPDGVRMSSLLYAGWTTAKAGTVATHHTVRTYDGSGTLLRTYSRTASVDYRAGTFRDRRSPADPVSSEGQATVRLTLGVAGSHRPDCSVTFVEPPA